jgi:cell division protein FtsI/penicillin-binding protein 2
VMMEVNTGAILAMVSYPTFNANAFTTFPIMGIQEGQALVRATQEDPRRPLLNRAAQGRYPSGSIMKAVTAIAAADSGVYALDQRYVCVGVWTRDIARLDWLANGHGAVTLPQALTRSCNPYFYEAGYNLYQRDPVLLPEYANRMGLGRPTGMTDIPESAGFIGTPETKAEITGIPWSFSDVVDMSIGQGFVEVSPLQMLRLYASIANNGTLYRPQLVQKVGLLDSFTYEMTPDPMERTGIKREVLDVIREGLCGVTTLNAGTATHIFRNSPLQDIGICGKTGTAQNTGGPLPHAWFVAYAPRENPEIAIIVLVENAGDGSAVAAPITRRVLEYYYFGTTGS